MQVEGKELVTMPYWHIDHLLLAGSRKKSKRLDGDEKAKFHQ